MRVRVKKTDTNLGIKEGEIYNARSYTLDRGKITLVSRDPDGYDPECNQYRHEVEILPEG